MVPCLSFVVDVAVGCRVFLGLNFVKLRELWDFVVDVGCRCVAFRFDRASIFGRRPKGITNA